MKIINIYLYSFCMLILASCSSVTGEKGRITDQDVVNYCQVYKKLKEQAPGILQKLNQEGNTEAAGQSGFNDFENTIKEGGIENYPAFVRLNAKIGSVYSIIKANEGMQNFENLESSSQDMMGEGMRIIQQQIDDPEVPEATKTELRKQIEEMKKGSQEISETYANNKKWANFVMDKVGKITNLIVNEQDIETIKRHQSEIFEAYTGFPEPVGSDGKLPPLKFE